VFALVLLSVGLFAGWPVLAKGVRVSTVFLQQ
jgi:phosphatidylinositol glycan class C protein